MVLLPALRTLVLLWVLVWLRGLRLLRGLTAFQRKL